MAVFVLTPGVDNFVGPAGEDNVFDFTPTTLQATDTVTGNTTAGFRDTLQLTAGGSVTAALFAGVTNADRLILSSAGNLVVLTNGLVAGANGGFFSVFDSGGNDTVDAIGVTNGVSLLFNIGAGDDIYIGGFGNDHFIFNAMADLSGDLLAGSFGLDRLVFTAPGTLAAGALSNVTGIDLIQLSNGRDDITITSALVAGSDEGKLAVFGGADNDTFRFNPADLSSSAIVIGGAGFDVIQFTAGGTVAAPAFNVDGIDAVRLDDAGNNVTLANSLVADSDGGAFFVIFDGTGNDVVDGSAVTDGTSLAIYSVGGIETFFGGTGDDLFGFDGNTLTSADTVVGGAGIDMIFIRTAGGMGTSNAADFAGASSIEVVALGAGGEVTLTDSLTTGSTLYAVGSSALDIFDGGAITGFSIVFHGFGGTDAFKGGALNDTFYRPDSNFMMIDANGGNADRIEFTTVGQVFDVSANASKISDVEVLGLDSTAGNAISVSLTGDDIPLISATENYLYVIGSSDDDVTAGDGWTQLETDHVNNAIAPGYTFIHYMHANGSDLYVADQIDLTIGAAVNQPPVAVDDTNTATEDVAGPTIGNVLANDDDGDPLIVQTLTVTTPGIFSGTYGDLFLNPDGSYAYILGATPAQQAAVQALALGTTQPDAFNYTVSDGLLTDTGTLTVNVSGANDPVSNTVPGGQSTNEDTAKVFSTGNGNAISVADVDDAPLTVTLSALQGTLTLSGIAGLSFTTGDGAGDATMTFSGTQAAINAALDGLSYQPNLNFSGDDTLTITTTDGPVTDIDNVLITVTADNDAPVNSVPAAQTVFEDADLVFSTGNGNAVSIADADAGGNDVTVLLAADSGVLTLFTTTGLSFTVGDGTADDAMIFSGTIDEINAALNGLIYHGNLNFNGSETISITTHDQGNTPPPFETDVDVINLTVDPVNDAPAGTDDTVTATDGVAYTFTAADFGFTDPDDAPAPNALLAVQITTLPSTGALNHTLNGPVTAGQVISAADIASGFLTFTQTGTGTTDFTFQVQDDGGTANLGVDLDQSANTLTINIVPPNANPVANDDTASATEAGGANNTVPGLDPLGNLVTGVGTGSVTDTDAEDPSTALTVVAVGTGAEGNPDNGTVGVFFSGTYGQLRLMVDGSYTYEVFQNDATVQALLAASVPLTDTFHYTIQDTGGAQSSASFTISVNGADDLPQANDDTGGMTEDAAATLFPVGANDVLDPDAGAANTIAITGTVTSNGPAGTPINDGDATAVVNGLQIEVTLNGDFQTLTASEFAFVEVPYTLTGNVGETDTATLTVTVTGANDGLNANDDTGTMSENDAPMLFDVRANDLLDVDHTAPNSISIGAVTASGPPGDGIDGADVTTAVVGNEVQITLGSDFQNLGDGETATIDVQYTLQGDQVGDTDTATLTVTVNGANDAPVAGDFTFNGANAAIGNTSFVVDDPTDGAPNPAGPQKTISGDLLAGATDVDTALSSLSITAETINNASGTLIIEADGDFTYLPAAGFTGNAVFNYTLNDNDPSGNATDTGQITIEVATPRVWYVDAVNGSALGDGTSDNPFDLLADVSGAAGLDQAGDIIYLFEGNYSGGITLLDNQTLWGAGDALVVNGVTVVPVGTDPTISNAAGNGVTVEQGNTLRGFSVGNTTGFDIANTAAQSVGTLNVSNVTLNGTGGLFRADTGGTLAVQLDSATTSNAGATGILINNTDNSSFTVSGLTTINDATADGISISNSQGSTFTFTGEVTILNDGGANGDGVDLQNNNATDSTFNFNGGVAITVNGAGAFGFRAQSSGVVNILDPSGTNQITSNNGTAIFINPTFFNASVDSVISGGGVEGISINGMTGSLTIGTATINGQTGDGIDITNTNGSVTINGGSIGASNDPAGIGVDIQGGTGNVTIGATVNKTTSGDVVEVTGRTTGTVDFNAAITSNVANGGGIDINGNSGGTVRFDGGMNLSTGATAAFNSTGNTGMTLVVTDTVSTSNILATTTGTALNVANTTIGAEDLTFQSISSNGATSGIILNTTGSSGGLTVTGAGAAGTGGSILNSTSDGVVLKTTIDPSLSFMNINDSGDSGINIDAVSGLNLVSLFMDSNGAQSEGGAIQDLGIHIEDLIGTSNAITNSTIQDSRNTNLDRDPNSSSSMSTLTVTNTNLNHAGEGVSSQGNAGINLVATGTANVKLVVSGGQIINNAAAGILVTGGSGTTVRTDISGVDMVSSAPPVDPTGASWGNGVGTNFGINLTSTGTAVQIHKIDNVDLAYTGIAPNDGGSASAIGFIPSGTGSFDITITNNTIGLVGAPRSGNENFFGIAGDIQDLVTVKANVSSNIVQNTALNGIFIQIEIPAWSQGTRPRISRSGTTPSVRSATTTISPSALAPTRRRRHAIRIESRNDSVLRLDIANNSADGLGGNQDYLVRQRDTSTFALERLGANTNVALTVETFIVGQNPVPAGQTARATVATTFTAIADGTVQNPALPLLAADGQGPGGADALTSDMLAPIVAEAVERWANAGITAEQAAQLDGVTVTIADLDDGVLAGTSGLNIAIDHDAAGWGWFVDQTPDDDFEFGALLSPTEFAASGGEAAAHIDLLTTVMHELGHALGLDHSHEPGDVMDDAIDVGIRRLPDAGDAAQGTQAASDTQASAAVVSDQFPEGVWHTDPNAETGDDTAAVPASPGLMDNPDVGNGEDTPDVPALPALMEAAANGGISDQFPEGVWHTDPNAGKNSTPDTPVLGTIADDTFVCELFPQSQPQEWLVQA